MSPEEQYQLCGSCCSFDNCNALPSYSSKTGSKVKPRATTTPTSSSAVKTQATTAKLTQKPHNGPHVFRCEICSGRLIKQDVKSCQTNTPYRINTINYAGMALTVTKG